MFMNYGPAVENKVYNVSVMQRKNKQEVCIILKYLVQRRKVIRFRRLSQAALNAHNVLVLTA
jgi:hypothetical protein